MKTVVGYVRVSTEGQVDNFGLEAQKEAIMRYCQRNEMYISEWFEDRGVSGVKEDRPALRRMLKDREICNPPIDAVVVAKSDRLARDINIYFYYKHELLKKGVELISVSEDFGAMGCFAPMLESFIICMAQMERENITMRTSSGRKVKAAAGGYAGGRPPYGYKVINHRLYIENDEAQVVKFIITGKKRGMTYQQIVDCLNEKGIKSKSGKKWLISTAQKILENDMLYRGYYKYGDQGDYVKGDFEPILTDEE